MGCGSEIGVKRGGGVEKSAWEHAAPGAGRTTGPSSKTGAPRPCRRGSACTGAGRRAVCRAPPAACQPQRRRRPGRGRVFFPGLVWLEFRPRVWSCLHVGLWFRSSRLSVLGRSEERRRAAGRDRGGNRACRSVFPAIRLSHPQKAVSMLSISSQRVSLYLRQRKGWRL